VFAVELDDHLIRSWARFWRIRWTGAGELCGVEILSEEFGKLDLQSQAQRSYGRRWLR
jgi:hypothetical protein